MRGHRCLGGSVLALAAAAVVIISLGNQDLRPQITLTHPGHSNATVLSKVPKLVHQMWKTEAKDLPYNLARWRRGCQRLNHGYEFRMYTDKSLSAFVQNHYQEYLELFSSLKGVYMADMARVLLAYHFGGIYMDLDFYCHRPFRCLEGSLRRAYNISHEDDNVLIVSREPLAHAAIFRNRSRVVIQDFFMATPRHQFLKWLLDDRLQRFNNHNAKKGPFSYAIEADIDRYHSYSRSPEFQNKQQNKTAAGRIIELPESVLHPLLDQSNSKLQSICNGPAEDISPVAERPCRLVRRKAFFNPTIETIAVHMWSHVYLGWGALRSFYSQGTYIDVEKKIPPTMHCHV